MGGSDYRFPHNYYKKTNSLLESVFEDVAIQDPINELSLINQIYEPYTSIKSCTQLCASCLYGYTEKNIFLKHENHQGISDELFFLILQGAGAWW